MLGDWQAKKFNIWAGSLGFGHSGCDCGASAVAGDGAGGGAHGCEWVGGVGDGGEG